MGSYRAGIAKAFTGCKVHIGLTYLAIWFHKRFAIEGLIGSMLQLSPHYIRFTWCCTVFFSGCAWLHKVDIRFTHAFCV